MVRRRAPRLFIECERPRRADGRGRLALSAAPSEHLDLVGMTGTSGKTTTTYLLRFDFRSRRRAHRDHRHDRHFRGGRKIYRGLTTPESLDFERALAAMDAAACVHAAAEISSIGIEEGRVDELSFRACVFTNLGRDHLDYHGTIENYFAAKLRLFTEIHAAQPARHAGRGGERRRSVRPARAGSGARRQAQFRSRSRARRSSGERRMHRNRRNSRDE